MIRGSTPTHNFIMPFSTDMIDRVRITYSQNCRKLFCKEREDCKFSGSTVSVRLSQEETLLFDHKATAKIQVKVKTLGGEVLLSCCTYLTVEETLDNEVI